MVTLLASPAMATDAVQDEYARRSKALSPTDAAGHFALAKWCRTQEQWQWVADECRIVLNLTPNHEPAKLLLDIARTKLRKKRKHDVQAGGRRGRRNAVIRTLSEHEIQRIRRAELYPDDREKARVRIDNAALRSFQQSASRDGSIDLDRAQFFRLPRLEQAQLILKHAPKQFGEKVMVQTDPTRMRTFLRKVQPIVIRGCGTADCHGGASGGSFRLLTANMLAVNVGYANYLMLHQTAVGKGYLIDRDQPERSLLLTYGLPASQVKNAAAVHPIPIRPTFRDRNDRDYNLVLDWLSSLAIERPDYGVNFKTRR